METIIGTPREFIIIERDALNELKNEIESLKNISSIFTNGKANGIEFVLNWIKEKNIYNKDFQYKH